MRLYSQVATQMKNPFKSLFKQKAHASCDQQKQEEVSDSFARKEADLRRKREDFKKEVKRGARLTNHRISL